MPEFGATSECKTCGVPIRFQGTFWEHLGDWKPRHPALPIDVKSPNAWHSNTATSGQCQGCGQEKGSSIIIVEVGETMVALCKECTVRLSALMADAVDENLVPPTEPPAG
jgi:hypothetical protein